MKEGRAADNSLNISKLSTVHDSLTEKLMKIRLDKWMASWINPWLFLALFTKPGCPKGDLSTMTHTAKSFSTNLGRTSLIHSQRRHFLYSPYVYNGTTISSKGTVWPHWTPRWSARWCTQGSTSLLFYKVERKEVQWTTRVICLRTGWIILLDYFHC